VRYVILCCVQVFFFSYFLNADFTPAVSLTPPPTRLHFTSLHFTFVHTLLLYITPPLYISPMDITSIILFSIIPFFWRCIIHFVQYLIHYPLLYFHKKYIMFFSPKCMRDVCSDWRMASELKKFPVNNTPLYMPRVFRFNN
jgi:hypothetical protein